MLAAVIGDGSLRAELAQALANPCECADSQLQNRGLRVQVLPPLPGVSHAWPISPDISSVLCSFFTQRPCKVQAGVCRAG